MTHGPTTPFHTTGPFYPEPFIDDASFDLAREAAASTPGECVELRGRVVDARGHAVVNAVLELWMRSVPGEAYRWGRCWTSDTGEYFFRIPRPTSHDVSRAPHLHLRILGSGLMRPLYTQIFFPGDSRNEVDPQLAAILDPEARARLIACRDDIHCHAGTDAMRFDIVLRGAQETPFLNYSDAR